MRTVVRRGSLLGAGLVLGVIGSPGAAYAHGIGSDVRSVSDFLWSGFTHMVVGWDHLLFIAGVLLVARQMGRAMALISLFTAGHSATLVVATLADWRVNATAVDVVIALSVVFVGAVGLARRPPDGQRAQRSEARDQAVPASQPRQHQRWRWFGAAVTAFGLVHGLGLATRLHALGLPEEGTLTRLAAFNVGIEIGQLIAIVVMYVVSDLVRHYLTWSKAPRAANAGLVAVGLVLASLIGLGAAG